MQQQNFFSLFDQAPTATATAPPKSAEVPIEKDAPATMTFVSSKQLELMKTSPFASFFRDKTIEEIKALDQTLGSKLYKKVNTAEGARKHALWYRTVTSAQTIALEKAYKEVDARFCKPEQGILFLVGKTGNKTSVNYKYDPFYFDKTGERTGLPVHHLEFNSAKIPTEISETGYRSHFFSNVPYAYVKSFADFIIQILRIQLKVTQTIVFEGVEFEFDASMLPATKTKPKLRKCPECDTKMKDDECPNCGFGDFDDDELTDEFDDE